jgi:hypothetical protein
MEHFRIDGVGLGGRQQALLIVWMSLRFRADDKAGSNPHAVGTQRQGCSEPPAVNNATRRDDWHWCYRLHHCRQERYKTYLAANVTTGFDALSHDDVHSSCRTIAGFFRASNLEHDHDAGIMAALNKGRRV